MTFDPLLCEGYDCDSDTPRSPLLTQFIPTSPSDIPPATAEAGPALNVNSKRRRRQPFKDPASTGILAHLAPNLPELSTFDPTDYDAASETDTELEPAMTALSKETGRLDGPSTLPLQHAPQHAASSQNVEPAKFAPAAALGFDATALKDRANAVLEHPAIAADLQNAGGVSAPDTASPDPADKRQRSGRSTPLRLRTQAQPIAPVSETIATSPTLSKHLMPVAEGADTTLPAMQSASPIRDGTATSPQTEKLPSLHQITGQISDPLNALSEVAALQDHRGPQPPQHHRHSFSSITSSSPTLLYHSLSATQPSPSAPFPLPSRSPAGAASERNYGSPPRHAPTAYFADRRPSAPIEHVPRMPPSLPSASSSGESLGHASSTTEGYSTAQTTPMSDATSVTEGTPRPMLPLASGPPPTAYRCEHPGCTAAPFATQYLLSSHQNVHSEQRSHFCPYANCPRGEGGKGFKRKNEMIRHQLVHKSPGYVCPFCPDREHKYPRPDNLQRHVRVHHVDKHRDDPLLCEVLAKRNDGLGKARRRRNTATSV